MTATDATRSHYNDSRKCPHDATPAASHSRRPPRWLTAGQGALTFPTAPVRAVLADVGTEAGLSLTDVADRLGISRRRLRRVMRQESISWQLADTLAVALGRHPSALWPQWFADHPKNRTAHPVT